MLSAQNNPLAPRKSLASRLKEQWPLWVFLFPGLLSFFLFSYLPFYGVITAFQIYNPVRGILNSRWVGLENFKYILVLPSFTNALRNTLVISLLKLLFCFPAPILFALMLNEIRSTRYKRAIQTVTYLPHFLSWVVAAGIWYRLLSPYNGALNHMLVALGLLAEGHNIIGDPSMFYPVLILTDLWKGMSWGSIIYLAAITSVNPELYEAAVMDGANRFRQTWHITLPGIKPTIVLMLILAVSNLLNAGFDQIANMTNKVVLEVGDILDTLILRTLTVGSTRDMSIGTAMGIMKSISGLLLFIIANTASRILLDESLI